MSRAIDDCPTKKLPYLDATPEKILWPFFFLSFSPQIKKYSQRLPRPPPRFPHGGLVACPRMRALSGDGHFLGYRKSLASELFSYGHEMLFDEETFHNLKIFGSCLLFACATNKIYIYI